jgi:hypothetical protein
MFGMLDFEDYFKCRRYSSGKLAGTAGLSGLLGVSHISAHSHTIPEILPSFQQVKYNVQMFTDCVIVCIFYI